jgi:hypothetical protein
MERRPPPGRRFAARLAGMRRAPRPACARACAAGDRRPPSRDERRLVDFLVVPAALQRRFPGEHHQRQVARTAAGSAVISCVTPGRT